MSLVKDGIPCGEVARVPESVAVCPECSGPLLLRVTAWVTGTGQVFENGDGVEVECINEPDPDDHDYREKKHRRLQSEWMPSLVAAWAWAARHVLVVLAPLGGVAGAASSRPGEQQDGAPAL